MGRPDGVLCFADIPLAHRAVVRALAQAEDTLDESWNPVKIRNASEDVAHLRHRLHGLGYTDPELNRVVAELVSRMRAAAFLA